MFKTLEEPFKARRARDRSGVFSFNQATDQSGIPPMALCSNPFLSPEGSRTTILIGNNATNVPRGSKYVWKTRKTTSLRPSLSANNHDGQSLP